MHRGRLPPPALIKGNDKWSFSPRHQEAGSRGTAPGRLPPPLVNEFIPVVGGWAWSCSPPTCQHPQARVAKQRVHGPGWPAMDQPPGVCSWGGCSRMAGSVGAGGAWTAEDCQPLGFLTPSLGMSFQAKCVLMSIILSSKYATKKRRET